MRSREIKLRGKDKNQDDESHVYRSRVGGRLKSKSIYEKKLKSIKLSKA